MKNKHGTLNKEFGFGIVDKDGSPWWDEGCVSEGKSGVRGSC